MKRDSVSIILYNDEYEMLLQHRSDDAPWMPGYWAFFGGGIEDAETARETLYRETFEELGYKLKSPVYVIGQDFYLKEIHGFMRVYADKFDDDPSVLELHEGRGMGWFTAEETEKLKMIDHDRVVIEKVDRYIRSCEL